VKVGQLGNALYIDQFRELRTVILAWISHILDIDQMPKRRPWSAPSSMPRTIEPTMSTIPHNRQPPEAVIASPASELDYCAQLRWLLSSSNRNPSPQVFQARPDFLSPAKAAIASKLQCRHGKMRSSCVEAAARSYPGLRYDHAGSNLYPAPAQLLGPSWAKLS